MSHPQLHRRVATALILISVLACALPAVAQESRSASAKVRFVLAGDSTVTDESGWGQGFAELLTDRAECVNLAKGGRSSRSYRTEGWWDKCLDSGATYLLIQFGHNDQPGKGPERESDAATDFRDHLRRYVMEARERKIRPILVTSLTRRRWTDSDKIEPTLADYAIATKAVAEELGVPLVDLHTLSIEQCERIGPTAFRLYEPMDEKGADHTHLNLAGSRAVAPLVAQALLTVVPETADCFSVEKLEQFGEPKSHATELALGELHLKEDPNAITITQTGKPVLVYNKVSPPVPDGMDPRYHRSGFLHPVATPAGRVVTAMFPLDHAHQHGIFSAWVKTKWRDREIDFWNLAKGTGRVLHQRVAETFADERGVGFVVDLIHRSESEPVVDILHEQWNIVARPTDGKCFIFDLSTTQTGLTREPLIVQEYHYGGVAYRGPVQWLADQDEYSKQSGDALMRESFEMRNDQDQDRLAGNGLPTRWVVATGQIDGQPATTIVLSHRDNFRAPQPARLHPTKPYFVFAPCVAGEFKIDREHPYQAKYRYLLCDEQPSTAWIEEQWTKWHTP